MKRLSEITPGITVIIREVENDELFLKLMEMGFIPGEMITVDQIAPLGDPISVSVAGYSLSLRLNEAKSVLVEELMIKTA
ncbi:FeoA family protein [Agriterribacter sp.]|uniref:FeoA family protein n=1 Tax=Agriterribacter sp. TaxID=2821509 RepID=UPI002C0EFFD0|nr:FeoA family protein [Agriterribacter sp.]HRO44488.1 FeoA family protein [Agriterribacter sp.]HRQ16486.1 FeoA family protein [Agriterribacter sp.]